MAVIVKNGERRICCEVPGCGRTASEREYGEGCEIICGKHYRLADKSLRQLLTKIRQRTTRYGQTEARYLADNAIWKRIRRQAVERAMGVE